jgi:hypothetical protein
VVLRFSRRPTMTRPETAPGPPSSAMFVVFLLMKMAYNDMSAVSARSERTAARTITCLSDMPKGRRTNLAKSSMRRWI